MLGAAAHISGHLFYAHATYDKLMYVGATAAALGPCVAPLIRSMTSKVLPASERGVAYAFLSVMENAVAMFASVIYTQLYKATINTEYINSIFYLTMITQAFVFLLALTMELLLKDKKQLSSSKTLRTNDFNKSNIRLEIYNHAKRNQSS
ncbi:hypothetical protein evm_015174 [Chilo suppressalis]|nr:hypothetical protein evm_015174 [Chilo suppressalis]